MRMSRIENYYHALDKIKNVSELLTVLQDVTEYTIINGFFISRLPKQDEELNKNILLRGWNEEWIAYYTRMNYVRDDPIAKELLQNSTTFVWSEICCHRKLSSLENRIMSEAYEAGLEDGLTVPVFGVGQQTTCVSFSTNGAQTGSSIDKEGRRSLQLIASLAVAKLEELSISVSNLPQMPCTIRPLAPREKQCLALAGKGLTSRQIETQTGLTYRTVDFYIGRAMQKLNASSRVEAICLAIKYRIISV